VRDLGLRPEQYSSLRNGEDVTLDNGTILDNSSYTTAPYASRSYAFCSDTVYLPELNESIPEVDLMYHETTFLRAEAQKARDTFHSTTEDAARMANHVGASMMLIGHFSSKYTDLNVYLDECREIFENTELAEEGRIFEVPRKRT
jgi:ribonuclease Z